MQDNREQLHPNVQVAPEAQRAMGHVAVLDVPALPDLSRYSLTDLSKLNIPRAVLDNLLPPESVAEKAAGWNSAE